MNAPEESKHTQRVQTLGRSLVTHLFQLFRSAEIYAENNDVFNRIAMGMKSYIEEGYRYFNNCSLKLSHHNVYISGNRIYIDFNILEAVREVSSIFDNAKIGGMVFLEDCLDPQNLIRGLLAFRESIITDQRKGVDAVKNGLIQRHTPFIEPLPPDGAEIRVTGLKDEENAKRFALKSMGKLLFFLDEMRKSVREGRAVNTGIGYRIFLNLVRIHESYPGIIRTFLHLPLRNRENVEPLNAALLTIITLGHLKAERQLVLNIAMDSLFSRLGEILAIGDQQKRTASERSRLGAKSLLRTRFVNRSFYFRLNYAYFCPLDDPKRGPFLVTLQRTLTQLAAFMGQGMMVQHAIVKGLKSPDPLIDKDVLLMVAKILGVLIPGQCLAFRDQFLALVEKDLGWDSLQTVQLMSCGESHADRPERVVRGSDEFQDWADFLKQVKVLPKAAPQPNPIQILF